MDKIQLEICCGSVQDALRAHEAGADQVELNSALFLGGLTPSVGALRVIKRVCPDIKVMCMVRPRESGFCYGDLEFETMLEDAQALIESGADGIVFGALTPERMPDRAKCERMLKVVGHRERVFHRAIDVAADPLKALDELMDMGFTRVLTSGQRPTALEGAPLIREMVQRSRGRIQILAGAGVRAENVRQLVRETGVNMVHCTAHAAVDDESVPPDPAIRFNGAQPPAEHQFKRVEPERVRQVRLALEEEIRPTR